MPRNYLVLGQWNVVCDRCGLEFKSSELQPEWTGLMVCTKCFEPRHPSTLFNPTTREGSIPWARPEPADVFIGPGGSAIQTEFEIDIQSDSDGSSILME